MGIAPRSGDLLAADATFTSTIVESASPQPNQGLLISRNLEDSFDLYSAELGKVRKIASFSESLQSKCGENLEVISQGLDLFHEFNEEHGELVDEIAARLKYLGLNKNLLTD